VEFKSQWIGYSLGMLAANCVVYLVLSWLAGLLISTDETEGRSLISVLVPLSIRKMFQTTRDEDAMAHGDIRGQERHLSHDEKSVRAYKVSKTYRQVQALKEVSFSMQRGEVFVLLGHNGAGNCTLYMLVELFVNRGN
jgi:ABC-type glutathione transport system ATPase component